MDFQQARHPIDTVVQWIKIGKIGLPDFQRDFVWSPSQIAELLDSVARQWPIGSLLLLSGPQPFAFREIDQAPKLNGESLDVYILDGQQRVTALYHAVANVSKYCYYVDFNDLRDGGGDLVKWSSRSGFERHYGEISQRARNGIALISDIWEQPKFFAWLSEVRKDAERMAYLQLRDEKLPGLQSKVYHVMALELEQGIGLEALARIFETINRTGVALNAFDLLVAKLYPTKFNLRERWDDAIDSNPLLRHFQPSELEILKLVALLTRMRHGKKASRGVRQGDLLALDAQRIIELWDEGVDRYVEALKIAVRYGAISRELIPSWSMVLGLAGAREFLDENETFDWWRAAIASQHFAQAANTKIVAEFDAGMQLGKSLQVLSADVGKELAQRPVRANGLLTNGIFSLIIKRGARDPHSGNLFQQESSVVLKSIDSEGRLGNVGSNDCIEGVVLVSANTARLIRKGDHIDRLAMWKEGLQSQGIDTFLMRRDSQFVGSILFGVGDAK